MPESNTAPAGGLWRLPGPRWEALVQLEQVEFLGAADGRPTVVDP